MTIVKKYILPYFFLFSALDSIFFFFDFFLGGKFSMIYLASSIFFSFYYILLKRNIYDLVILFSLFTIALISATKNIDYRLYYSGIRYQLVLTIFFFVGKYYSKYDLIFDRGRFVVLAMAIIGLLLFLIEPAWYISLKTSHVEFDLNSGDNYFELLRLSGFSSYPYWISYGCFIIFSYYMTGVMWGRFSNKRFRVALFFLFLIMILCAQRAPIVSSIGVVIFCTFYKSKSKVVFIKKLLLLLLSVSFISVILFVCLKSYIDTDQINFIAEKFEVFDDGASGFLKQRAADFKLKTDITLTGAGIGLYSHSARLLGKFAIPDQQYLRILYETGILGCTFYFVFFSTILIKGLIDLKHKLFEVIIVVFYLLTMTGANSLSMEAYHTAVFWLCCGRIFRKRSVNINKVKSYEKSTSNSVVSTSVPSHT